MAKKQANPMDGQVGRRLRERRTTIGMSQERLGQLLGVTFQQIQKYERGVNRIAAGRLFQIAQILAVEIDYFYGGLGTQAGGFAERAGRFEPHPEQAQQIELGMAFSRIRDPKRRRQALEYVKRLAAGEAEEEK